VSIHAETLPRGAAPTKKNCTGMVVRLPFKLGKEECMSQIKEQIGRKVEGLAQELFAVSDFLKANPETAYQEFKACEYLCGVLAENRFQVQKGAGNVETALWPGLWTLHPAVPPSPFWRNMMHYPRSVTAVVTI
jgi:hypothetical protein